MEDESQNKRLVVAAGLCLMVLMLWQVICLMRTSIGEWLLVARMQMLTVRLLAATGVMTENLTTQRACGGGSTCPLQAAYLVHRAVSPPLLILET